jgi:hypothetical protein
VRTELAEEAQQFGAVVRAAIESAGGDRLVEQVERHPAERDTVLDGVLGDLGVWDLDIRSSADELEAAAAVCRAVGSWSEPAAVAARLLRPADGSADAVAVITAPRPQAPMQMSALRWDGIDLEGARYSLSARPTDADVRSTGFVVEVDNHPRGHAPPGELTRALVLPVWTLLGMFDRAVELTAAYVRDREQFGRPLAAFQSVQFQLTEAEVERVGVDELAKYTLWSVATGRPEALVDALALRVAALEAAETIFAICHQLHGAIGFCDETTISWLSRASQPLRRQPLTRSGTLHELVRRMGRSGLVGLYPGGSS